LSPVLSTDDKKLGLTKDKLKFFYVDFSINNVHYDDDNALEDIIFTTDVRRDIALLDCYTFNFSPVLNILFSFGKCWPSIFNRDFPVFDVCCLSKYYFPARYTSAAAAAYRDIIVF
jgi:hypothetical protein